MRDDCLAGLAQQLVRAGVLGVPVSIEYRLHRPGARQRGHRLQQRARRPRRHAIHQHDAVSADVRDDVGLPGKAQDEEIVGQPLDGGVGLGRQPVSGRTEEQARGAADRGLEQLAACVTVRVH